MPEIPFTICPMFPNWLHAVVRTRDAAPEQDYQAHEPRAVFCPKTKRHNHNRETDE